MNEWDDEILKALVHPIRRRIILNLHDKNRLSYNELLRSVEIGNHGKLGFHLRALKGLVEHEPSTKTYHLTDKGLLASELIWDIRFILSRGSRDLAQEPTRYVQHLTSGDHAVLLFDMEKSKQDITFPFLEAGLAKNQASVYFVAENKLDSESKKIQRYGINAAYFTSGAFTIMSAEEMYLRKGKAEAKKIMANFLALLKRKQKAGFKGIRVAGEMNIFLGNAKIKELFKYETMLGKKLPCNATALCLYEAHSIDENQINDLNKCHGHLICKDLAWKIV